MMTARKIRVNFIVVIDHNDDGEENLDDFVLQ
jgi:hypothetical protein